MKVKFSEIKEQLTVLHEVGLMEEKLNYVGKSTQEILDIFFGVMDAIQEVGKTEEIPDSVVAFYNMIAETVDEPEKPVNDSESEKPVKEKKQNKVKVKKVEPVEEEKAEEAEEVEPENEPEWQERKDVTDDLEEMKEAKKKAKEKVSDKSKKENKAKECAGNGIVDFVLELLRSEAEPISKEKIYSEALNKFKERNEKSLKKYLNDLIGASKRPYKIEQRRSVVLTVIEDKENKRLLYTIE